ncbi:ABC transporter permease [Clostridium amazonitimonense]|uniref:ABC transporter permease n=1 Tax=Clostridium amazonitimonense TaxID=1499689 RepID=UPI0005096E96|nr:FtsX-like permease family protein [Clostridium amazonitimonense]
MGLLEISIKNIKRNIANYILYFLSLTFIVLVFFTFSNIQYISEFLTESNFLQYSSLYFSFMNSILIFFSALFLWYCNSFFIKKRSKEFALYSVLGVKKRTLGFMVFFETLVIGLLALILGLLLGIVFLKLFLMILLSLMSLNTNNARFYLSYRAIKHTTYVFLIVFLVTSIKNFISIKRIKLLRLFKGDTTLLKEPKASILLSILFVALMVKGYTSIVDFYINASLNPESFFKIFKALAYITLATYGIYSTFILLIVKLSKKNKFHYYKSANMISTSRLLYRLRKNAFALANITLLIAGTIIAVGSVFSYYHYVNQNIPLKEPFSFCYISDETSFDKEMRNIIEKYPDNGLLSETEATFIRVNGNWPQLGSTAFQKSDSRFSVISLDEYKKLSNALGFESPPDYLEHNEVLITDINYYTGIVNDYKKSIIRITNNNKSYKIAGYYNKNIINDSLISRLVVVNNNEYNSLKENQKIYRFKGFLVKNSTSSNALNNELKTRFDEIIKENNLTPPNEHNLIENNFASFYEIYHVSAQGSGSILFCGSFLGFIFLICTASMIFFKQLSDATDDKYEYDILRNLGASEKEIKRCINKQVVLFFLIPLFIGVLHSILILNLISFISTINMFKPIFFTLISYTVIYLVYCKITINSYYKIIESE